MSGNEDLRMKLRSSIFRAKFSRLPKDVREVHVENAKAMMEQTIAKMKESVKKNDPNDK